MKKDHLITFSSVLAHTCKCVGHHHFLYPVHFRGNTSIDIEYGYSMQTFQKFSRCCYFALSQLIVKIPRGEISLLQFRESFGKRTMKITTEMMVSISYLHTAHLDALPTIEMSVRNGETLLSNESSLYHMLSGFY